MNMKHSNSRFREPLANTSLRPFLETRMFQKMGAMLSGEDMSVLIDLVTVRLSAWFAHADDTMQQLLYHPDSRQHKPGSHWVGDDLPNGKWSIQPIAVDSKTTGYPVFPIGRPQSHTLDASDRSLSIAGIPLTCGAELDWDIRIVDDSLQLRVSAPEGTTAGLEIHLYPLYTTVESGGMPEPLDYAGSAEHKFVGQSVTLCDAERRMPDLEFTPSSATISVKPYNVHCDGHRLEDGDPSELYPRGLCVTATGEGQILDLSIRIAAHQSQQEETVTYPDLHGAAVSMANTVLAIRDQCAETLPALRGVLPSAISFADLTPHRELSSDYVSSTYTPRAIMSLCAAAYVSRDPSYALEGLGILKSYLDHCHVIQGTDAIFVVGGLKADGSILDAEYDSDGNLMDCFYHRPSNFAIVIRGLLYCHDALRDAGDDTHAGEALDLAARIRKGLELVFGTGFVYVNNPHYTLALLVKRLEEAGHPEAQTTRDYLMRELATRPAIQAGPGELAVCKSGACESCPNTEQDFASIASEHLAHWLLTSDPRSDQAVRDICRIMTWGQRFFVDTPDLTGSSIVESLERYDGGYTHVAYHGGMWDLVRMEMLLAAAEHLGDEFSAEAARLLFESRLRWSYRPDGTVRGAMQQVPGVTFVNDSWSEIHNYGVFGLYLTQHFRNTKHADNTIGT